jgi:hypothetical protein
MSEKMKKGGAQPGAGRPQKEKTKLVRVPIGIIDSILQIINEYRKTKK